MYELPDWFVTNGFWGVMGNGYKEGSFGHTALNCTAYVDKSGSRVTYGSTLVYFVNDKIHNHGDFKLALTKKSRPCRGTFARANQADRCMNLLHCAQRSTPGLLDTRGFDRNVECFSLFERYVTLPVGTRLIALQQSSRSQWGRLLRTSQSHYFVLWGERNKLFR